MTSNTPPQLGRRELLASAGAVGIGALGLTRRFGSQTANEPEYTNYTLAQTDSSNINILVGWYGTYDTGNGQELLTGQPIDNGEWDYNNTAGYEDDVASTIEQSVPVVAIDDVLPGDSGTLSIGITPEPESAPAQLWLRLTDSGGAISDVLDIDLWYDTGIFGIGGCQGAEDGAPQDAPYSGTLDALTDGPLGTGVLLDPPAHAPCFEPGERLCLGLAWSIDESIGNAYQQSTVGFDIEIGAIDCENTANPFDESEVTQ